MIKIGGGLTAYRSDPPVGNGAPPIRGGIILIHEIWGLVDHIKGVADRLAAEGYVVVAPDILSNAGITPEIGAELHALTFESDAEARTEAQPMMREKLAPSRSPEYASWAVHALRTVVDFVAAQPGVSGRVAVTGFCFGGGYSFALAAADQRIRAAVPFYGYPPSATEVAEISCPVLAFYGDQDETLMASLPGLTATMVAASVDFSPRVYRGARHAFFNDTNNATYDPGAAADAWKRMLKFLDATLA